MNVCVCVCVSVCVCVRELAGTEEHHQRELHRQFRSNTIALRDRRGKGGDGHRATILWGANQLWFRLVQCCVVAVLVSCLVVLPCAIAG